MDLEPLSLPSSPEGWASWLDQRGRGSLQAAAGKVEELTATPAGDVAILERWNDIGIALANSFAITSLLSSVHPDAAVIEQAEGIEVEAHRYLSDLHLDRAVYDQLLVLTPSPVVELNRAVAVAELDGPEVALAIVDRLDLGAYHPFHVTRAELLRRLGRSAEARAAYDAALGLVENEAERAHLINRRDSLPG